MRKFRSPLRLAKKTTGFEFSQEFTESRGFLPWREQRITLSYGIFFDGVLRHPLLSLLVGFSGFWFVVDIDCLAVTCIPMLLSDLLLRKLCCACMAHVSCFIFHFASIHLDQGHFFYMQVEMQQITWDMKSRWKNHPVFLNSYHMKFKSSHVKGNQWKVSMCFWYEPLHVYTSNLPRGAN